MQRYYSKSVNGFFSSDYNTNIPLDAVEISEERYQELFNQMPLTGDENGYPISLNPNINE